MDLEKQNGDGEDVGEIHGMNATDKGGHTCTEVTRVMEDPMNG
jgi:hypothetical protein